MKYLFLILVTFPVFACKIQVPTSEAQRYMDAMPNGVPPLYKCEDKPDEKCHCVDHIVWEHAEFEDDIIFSHYEKLKVKSCEKLSPPEIVVLEGMEGQGSLPEATEAFNEYQDCEDKFEALKCGKESEKIKNYELMEVYCAKPVMKVDGKKLVNSEVKKAEHETRKKAEKVAEKAKQDNKKALKQSIKQEIKDANTVAKLRALVEKMIEVQE